MHVADRSLCYCVAVEHSHWNGILLLFGDGRFIAPHSSDEGCWSLEDNRLTFKWDRWPIESVTSTDGEHFLSEIMNCTMRRASGAAMFFAQHGEDRWIIENLVLPARGVFIDVGASDGIHLSNSLFLENLGWSGLLIEPDPRRHAAIRATRRAPLVDCAIGVGQGREFRLHSNPDLSGFLRTEGQAVTVRTASLSQVLEEYQVKSIDLLSIDTEGTEVEVWRSLSVEKYSPRIVIAEWATWGIAKDETELKATIENDGYRLVHRTEVNYVFVRNDA